MKLKLFKFAAVLFAGFATAACSADDKHPAVNGAYLKSCASRLMPAGKPFGDDAANCDTDAASAVFRKTAKSIISGHESDYLIENRLWNGIRA